ncbi:MAG TPA: SDR family NAD(P)-dependent oxidoreductase [Anaerolineales bacterium]|nr:SDR family NAD(P)-dependent oxidoreductase [Anaerolineales bacterium]
MSVIDEKVVLVTGASSGIGKTIAEHLQARGFRVFGTQRRAGGRENAVPLISMDVDDDESVQQGVQKICQAAGRLDAVINNAGFAFLGAVEETSLAEAKAQFETNFFGVLRVCKAVLPIMRGQGSGYLINISSLGGVLGTPFSGLYCAAKFALEGMSESLRFETNQFGVKVVLIEPGDFKTGFTLARRLVEASKTSAVYRESFRRFMEAQSREEANAPTPEPIAYLAERILNDPNPRLRYNVGMLSQRIVIPLKRFLPQGAVEWILRRSFSM